MHGWTLPSLPLLKSDVDDYRGHVRTRLAIHLMALTFVRTSELIKAEWSEFNLAAAQWRIPGRPYEDENRTHRAAVHPGGGSAAGLAAGRDQAMTCYSQVGTITKSL